MLEATRWKERARRWKGMEGCAPPAFKELVGPSPTLKLSTAADENAPPKLLFLDFCSRELLNCSQAASRMSAGAEPTAIW